MPNKSKYSASVQNRIISLYFAKRLEVISYTGAQSRAKNLVFINWFENVKKI